jgi:ABC-type transport system involved in cytochrome c biogenesis permease subunit
MTLLMGGTVSAVLGLIGMVVWRGDFLVLIKGGLPLLLLLGGMLAVYLGVDDIQTKLREEREKQEEDLAKAMEEIEMIKARAEQYREELERLKEEAGK